MPGEYAFLQKLYPRLVEALGDHLVINDDQDGRDAIPLIFVFFGTERQRLFWLRDKDIDPKHVRLALDIERLQGLRARVIPVSVDPFWHPVGIDERYRFGAAEWYIKDMESKVGSLWDVRHEVNPIPENERWVRLA
jgi:hypothetical protein